MTYLLIPAAGASSRFSFTRPKFLLQHPLGGTMLQHSISGLGNLESFGVDKILIVSLEQYFTDISIEKLGNEIFEVTGIQVEFLLLNDPTGSMVETIVKGITHIGHEVSLIIKDCDNLVELSQELFSRKFNIISSVDLAKFPNIRADNKSFLKISTDGMLENIVEKRIISSFINVGCIKFESSSDFLSCALELQGSSEIYVSDIVRLLLEKGEQFLTLPALNYEDWGTQEDWLKFTSTFSTYFVDIDGVLALNENPLSKSGGWQRIRPIESNCAALLELQNSGRTKLIFTTTRSIKFKQEVQVALESIGFKSFELLMDLPHAKRILINDFAPTNPYPTAVAINLERNSSNLQNYF